MPPVPVAPYNLAFAFSVACYAACEIFGGTSSKRIKEMDKAWALQIREEIKAGVDPREKLGLIRGRK